MAKQKYPDEENLVEAVRSLLNYCQMQLRHSGVRSARLRAEMVEDEDEENVQHIYLLPQRMRGRRKGLRGVAEKIANGNNGQLRQQPFSLPKIV